MSVYLSVLRVKRDIPGPVYPSLLHLLPATLKNPRGDTAETLVETVLAQFNATAIPRASAISRDTKECNKNR